MPLNGDVLMEAHYALQVMRHQGALGCLIDTNNHHFIYVSPSWERLLGWSDDEMIGHSYWDFIHPEDAEIAKKAEEEFSADEFAKVSIRYKCKGGGYKSIVWVGDDGVLDKDTGVIAAIAFSEDKLKGICDLWKTT